MADDRVLKFTLVHGSKKYPIELPINDSEKAPTVEDIANLAAELAEVPRGSQRLIFKGQSLTDFTQPLLSLGVKTGSKVLLIGKKFNPLDEENMKAILATEKTIDDLERRLNEYTEELSGIEKGFLGPDLIPKALEKLTRKFQAVNEDFMRTLESLDALIIDPSLKEAKGKRKSLVKRIQVLLEKADEMSSRIEPLKKTC